MNAKMPVVANFRIFSKCGGFVLQIDDPQNASFDTVYRHKRVPNACKRAGSEDTILERARGIHRDVEESMLVSWSEAHLAVRRCSISPRGRVAIGKVVRWWSF